MKRIVLAAAILLVMTPLSSGYARPVTAPPAPSPGSAPTPPSRQNAVIYYKPSPVGSDTTTYPNDRTAASVTCVENFSLVVVEGRHAYCKRFASTTMTVPLVCAGSGPSLVVDTAIPPLVRSKTADADQCLKADAPTDAAASYFAPICGQNSTGGGFGKVVRPGPDTCEKVISVLTIQRPGSPKGQNMVMSQTFISAPPALPTEPAPTAELLATTLVTCPANATLERDGASIVCRRT
ncbi:MAG: hypothetical protein U0169_08395 [Polyangiaceae bacterium]